MSDRDERVIPNPLREGDYLVYADAEKLPSGGWAGFYRIDLHPEGQPLGKTVIPRKIFGNEVYMSEDIARVFAISYGQNFVRSTLVLTKD